MKLKVFLPDRCSCMADPGMLETVVKNILVNAVRYSPEGENIGVNLFERQGKGLWLKGSSGGGKYRCLDSGAGSAKAF
mgnify:CR=1 FL=1